MKSENTEILTESRDKFFDFVKLCNGNYRLVTPSIYLYKKIIEKHKHYGSMNKLLDDDEFIELIYMTLIAWNMNQRGAKMVQFKDFKNSILKNKEPLEELYKYKIYTLDEEHLNEVLEKTKKVFLSLRVMKTKSQIVGISKTMHFLLPDLIMPIDRRYTMNFFYGNNAYRNERNKEFQQLKEIFIKFYEISKKLKLSDRDVDNFNWNTSVPKLIDNAIIGIKNSE